MHRLILLVLSLLMLNAAPAFAIPRITAPGAGGGGGLSASADLTITCEDNQIMKYDSGGGTWQCEDDQGSGSGDDVSVDGGDVVNPDFDSGGDIDFVDTSNTVTGNINADAVSNDEISPQAVSIDQLEAENKPADEQFLTYEIDSLKGQWVTFTASLITDQNAGTDITADLEEDAHCSEHNSADVDCSGETIVLANDSVSNDEVNSQGISTDMLEAENKPTDEQFFTYEASSLKGQWTTFTASLITDQNGGTDITADLEEESHCSEHDSDDVDCSGETIVLANDSVSNDEINSQGVSTDMLEASNKPTDGLCFSYNATTLKGEWVSCGGGSGDSVRVNETAIDTTADFESTGDIAFSVSDGGAGGPDDITADINADAVSNDEVASQGISTDMLEATNKPTDGLCFTYNATALKGEWGSCGSGGGDSVRVDSTAVDTTADFESTGDIDFVISDGGAGGPDDITGNINADAVSNDEVASQGISTDMIEAINKPTDAQVLSYDAGSLKGEWIAQSGGSSTFYWVLRPQQAKLPTSNSQATDAADARWEGLYDASAHESATWETVLYPYGGGTISADISYSMASATTNEVHWAVHVDCQNPSSGETFDTESFGTSDDIVDTVPGTQGYLGSAADSSLNEDSCAQYDNIVVKIARNGGHADDDATGDAELRKVLIYET